MVHQFLNNIIQGDSLEILKKLPDNSIDLVITSPPYYQQRNYGNGKNEIGNEANQEEYIGNLLQVFHECVRVIKDTGTIVFNLGDKYINGGLQLIPYKFAIGALENENVFLVNQITWNKLNPTPRQDKRKLVQSTEPFFVFAKSKKYKFKIDDYLQHLDFINKKKFKARNGIGKKYFELIEKSGLTHEEKKNAKKELNKAIDMVLKRTNQ